jgi:hypothetical protein
MKTVNGQLRRITDPAAFAQSWLATNGKPTKGHAPWGGARIHLVTDFPSGAFSHSLMPSMTMRADTDAQGRFAFNAPDALGASRGALVAFQVTMAPPPLPGMPAIPVLDPVYRSQPFKFSAVPATPLAAARILYAYPATTPDSQGVTQATVDKLIGTMRKNLKLDKLSATIGRGRVSVRAEERGATVAFNAYVRGATVPDLGRVIEVKAGEIDFDLPGPDFITTICVDEGQIERQIRDGLTQLSKDISKTLLKELDKQLPGLSAVAGVSVWRTRWVQTGTKKIKIPGTTVEVPVFAAVPDASVGLPRAPY